MTFWDVAPYSLVEVYPFPKSNPETSANFYGTTWRSTVKSNLYTRCRENLKSHRNESPHEPNELKHFNTLSRHTFSSQKKKILFLKTPLQLQDLYSSVIACNELRFGKVLGSDYGLL
jgi:hypothetical protein